MNENEDLFEITQNEDGYPVIDGYSPRITVDDPDWYDVKAENTVDPRMAKIWRTVAASLRREKADRADWYAETGRWRSNPEDGVALLFRENTELRERIARLEAEIFGAP